MKEFKKFIEKVFYVVGANLVGLFVSVITTLFVPKFLGNDTSQYGYLQIYLFYISYAGLFHLGWCDGIFLRDGGKKYEDLDKQLYSSQFWLLTIFEVVIAFLILLYGYLSPNKEYNFGFLVRMISLNILVYLPRLMLQYFLQTTNRMKQYARITTVGRSFYGVSIIIIIMFFSQDYRWFVIADLLAKIIALIVSIWICRDIVFARPVGKRIAMYEAKVNILVGIKLMFANIASMLIIGIARLGVQIKWNIATYGNISFTLSVSNLLLTFINAIAVVLYPTLRRIDKNKLSNIYEVICDSMMLLLFGCLILYYPIQQVLLGWLPQYAEGMKYMAILFPMCIYSAKMTMLIQTYMNTYRLEKQMLKVNLVGVLVAAFTTIISVFILEDLTITMVSIVINTVFRCVYAELVLSKYVNIFPYRNIKFELALTVIFIITQWYIGGLVGLALYGLSYTIYFALKMDFIFKILKKFIHK